MFTTRRRSDVQAAQRPPGPATPGHRATEHRRDSIRPPHDVGASTGHRAGQAASRRRAALAGGDRHSSQCGDQGWPRHRSTAVGTRARGSEPAAEERARSLELRCESQPGHARKLALFLDRRNVLASRSAPSGATGRADELQQDRVPLPRLGRVATRAPPAGIVHGARNVSRTTGHRLTLSFLN